VGSRDTCFAVYVGWLVNRCHVANPKSIMVEVGKESWCSWSWSPLELAHRDVTVHLMRKLSVSS